MLMVSTTGEHAAYYVLDEALRPIEREMPLALKRSVDRALRGDDLEASPEAYWVRDTLGLLLQLLLGRNVFGQKAAHVRRLRERKHGDCCAK